MPRLLERLEDGCRQRRAGAHHGRDGHRQGARRAPHPRPQPSRRRALRRGQLRRLPRDAARGRALRPRARRLHRGGEVRARAASRRPTAGRCCSTRSPRCRCRRRPSSCACCRRGGRAARHQRIGPGRRADRVGHPPRSETPHRRGAVPGGSLLPPQRASPCTSPRCASRPVICRCWCTTSYEFTCRQAPRCPTYRFARGRR